MDADALRNWSKAPASLLWTLASAGLTFAVKQSMGLRKTQLNWNRRYFSKDGEYWRAVTPSMYFDKVEWYYLVYILITLFSISSAIERKAFKNASLKYLCNLIIAAALIHVPGMYIKELRMQYSGPIFFLAIATWYGLELRNAKVPLFGPVYGYGWILPFVVVGVRFFSTGQNVQDLKMQALGVLVGILCKLTNSEKQDNMVAKLARQEQAKRREEAANNSAVPDSTDEVSKSQKTAGSDTVEKKDS